jgi:hypothetical protein
VGTFEEAARPDFEPVGWVGPGRSQVGREREAIIEAFVEVRVAAQ